MIWLQDVSKGYGARTLFEGVHWDVKPNQRVGLVGPNGAGKTTLLKLMVGELVPTGGALRPHPHLRMARFTQHFVDTLDLRATPLEYFQTLLPDHTFNEVRGKLGRFGVTGEFQTQVMATLSDGIKARVVFAQMASRNPHILMLDEPTNHLDAETIDSLAGALNAFEGGVVLVSHDMRLIDKVAKEIWHCENKQITRFPGDMWQYKQAIAKKLEDAAHKFEAERRGGKRA